MDPTRILYRYISLSKIGWDYDIKCSFSYFFLNQFTIFCTMIMQCCFMAFLLNLKESLTSCRERDKKALKGQINLQYYAPKGNNSKKKSMVVVHSKLLFYVEKQKV